MTGVTQANWLGKLKSDLLREDKLREILGLPPSEIVQVVITTTKPPSGSVYIRTPFGYGYVLNCKKTNEGKWQTCANVKRSRVEKAMKKEGI